MTFRQLRDQIDRPTSTGGVYVVVRGAGKLIFLTSNPGGRFKGKDPSVSLGALRANWVDGAEVVYIGKADNLRRRLGEFTRFGEGNPIGHWGGR